MCCFWSEISPCSATPCCVCCCYGRQYWPSFSLCSRITFKHLLLSLFLASWHSPSNCSHYSWCCLCCSHPPPWGPPLQVPLSQAPLHMQWQSIQQHDQLILPCTCSRRCCCCPYCFLPAAATVTAAGIAAAAIVANVAAAVAAAALVAATVAATVAAAVPAALAVAAATVAAVAVPAAAVNVKLLLLLLAQTWPYQKPPCLPSPNSTHPALLPSASPPPGASPAYVVAELPAA